MGGYPGATRAERDTYQARIFAEWSEGRIAWEWGPDLGGWQAFRFAARHPDGTRVRVTATTAQIIADTFPSSWGVRILTPVAVDLIRSSTGARVTALALPNDGPSQPGNFQKFDARADAALDAAWPAWRKKGAPGYVCEGGKDWVLTEELLRRRAGSAVACNYGFFVPDRSKDPNARPSITGRFRLIQQPGYAHDAAHWDYSQTLRLGVGDVPSHDGLTGTRQPGIVAPAEGAAMAAGVLGLLALL